jgi:hypothetical protein
MKIEIKYNPSAVYTSAVINGVLNKENDMYNFIFPVKKYPLQCWINKNGSWAGIASNIRDISRGDDLNIIFTGRKIDYEDFKGAIDNYGWIQKVDVSFIERVSDYERLLKLLHEASVKLEKINFSDCSTWDIIKRCEALKKSFMEKKTFVKEIYNKNELAAIIPELGYTYVVHDTALEAFSDFEKLLRLPASMLVPADSIICIFKAKDKMENFKSYASALNSQIRFSLKEEETQKIYKKYSEPAKVQYIFDIFEEIYGSLKKLQTEEDLNDRLVKLNMNAKAFDDDTFEKKREELIGGKKWIKENKDNISSFIEAMKKVHKLPLENGGITGGRE